jgi:hypothetical protein
MIRRAEQLEDMAQECRRLARAASHEPVRQELLEVADRFERLAQHHRHSESQDTRSPKIRLPISAR